jgi:hypothetical protein
MLRESNRGRFLALNASTLLLADAIINLGLGALLIAFPSRLVHLLGVPDAPSKFYPNLLGAVLLGIGIALLIERYKPRAGMIGLGLSGAIAINLCGGLVLALWLILGELSIPTRGYLVLGLLALLLVGISVFELRTQLRPAESGDGA